MSQNLSISEDLKKEWGIIPSISVFTKGISSEKIDQFISKYELTPLTERKENGMVIQKFYYSKHRQIGLFVNNSEESPFELQSLQVLYNGQSDSGIHYDEFFKSEEVYEEQTDGDGIEMRSTTTTGLLVKGNEGISVIWDYAKIQFPRYIDDIWGDGTEKEIDQLVSSEDSGIIYIKGKSGSGKTSYMRLLCDKYGTKDRVCLRFAPMYNFHVDTSLIEYLYEHDSPPVLFIEDFNPLSQIDYEQKITYLNFLLEPRPEWKNKGITVCISGLSNTHNSLDKPGNILFEKELNFIEKEKAKQLIIKMISDGYIPKERIDCLSDYTSSYIEQSKFFAIINGKNNKSKNIKFGF